MRVAGEQPSPSARPEKVRAADCRAAGGASNANIVRAPLSLATRSSPPPRDPALLPPPDFIYPLRLAERPLVPHGNWIAGSAVEGPAALGSSMVVCKSQRKTGNSWLAGLAR